MSNIKTSQLEINGRYFIYRGLGLRFGAGAQYNFNEHLAARAMIRYSDIDVEGVDKIVDLTAGVRYTF